MATPQWAIPQAGSAVATSVKASTAASRWKECSSATARSNRAWTAGAQEVANRTVPRRSAGLLCAWMGPAVRAVSPTRASVASMILMGILPRQCAMAPGSRPQCYALSVADLVNEFSWSRTRDNVFQDCRRRYYYQYYGAWGGWDADSDPLVRRLYVLKQLATRQMWAGRLVHEAIERSLLALRDGHALTEASLIEDTVRQMREEWKGSRAGVYREAPKRPSLFEHEYGVAIRDSEWQALRDHVVRCLRNFHRLPLLTDIKRTPTERWVFIEDIGSFPFEGIRVFSRARLRLLESRRPAAARGLEDRGRRRGRRAAARRLRPLRARGPGRRARAGRSAARSTSARAR